MIFVHADTLCFFLRVCLEADDRTRSEPMLNANAKRSTSNQINARRVADDDSRFGTYLIVRVRHLEVLGAAHTDRTHNPRSPSLCAACRVARGVC